MQDGNDQMTHIPKSIKINPLLFQSVLELIAKTELKVQKDKISTHNLAVKKDIPRNHATKIINTMNKKRSASKLLDSCPNVIWAPGPRIDCISEKTCFFLEVDNQETHFYYWQGYHWRGAKTDYISILPKTLTAVNGLELQEPINNEMKRWKRITGSQK